ncbi:MAG: bifunctional riboflavin kinase/FAD synthetase [Anaerovoracaceae bacterium]
MKIFNSLEEIKNIDKTVIALGNFDGIHLGHQEIIRRTVADAKSAGIKSAVFTFANHPRNLLKNTEPVKNILYSDDKQRIMESYNIDYLFNIPFTDEIMEMKPTDFIEKLLIDKLNMQEVLCGFNYRFGYKASGNVEILMKESFNKGFGIHILEPYKVGDEVVSSTLIRKYISMGNMEMARKLLGRPYSIGGEVVVGNRLGKTIGFPTSNINIDESMVSPPNGVYITNCIYNGVTYSSITNVGVKPTIGTYNKNVETHIFNFDKELYGKNIRVDFLEKLRDERVFDSVEDLSKEITANCITARAYHRQHQK